MRSFRLTLPILLLTTSSLLAWGFGKGSKVTVRTSTTVTSDRSVPGDEVGAELASDLVIDGKLIASKGAKAVASVSSATPSSRARVEIPGEVSIRLESVETAQGIYHLSTNEYTRRGKQKGNSPFPRETGGGISIDSVGGVHRQSPLSLPDASTVTLSVGGLDAVIPADTVITFKVIAASSPVPKN